VNEVEDRDRRSNFPSRELSVGRSSKHPAVLPAAAAAAAAAAEAEAEAEAQAETEAAVEEEVLLSCI
jgi:hypothetical protein